MLFVSLVDILRTPLKTFSKALWSAFSLLIAIQRREMEVIISQAIKSYVLLITYHSLALSDFCD
jgi:hypothetical protein